MEYIDGSSLQEIVKRVGPLGAIRSAHYISQAALGLQHAHEAAGLVHRDIKPGNLLVDRSGTVKVLDMGLARFFHDEEDLLTKKYDENVLGTADYLAPEQALDSHSVDIRADIYSLGATFYYCLTGRAPFAEGTVAQKLIWHQTRQPKSIRSLQPDVPEQIVVLVEKMMAKDPAHRFQMPIEVCQALAPWTGTPIPPPSDQEMPQLSLAAAASGSSDAISAPSTSAAAASPASRTRRGWEIANQTKTSQAPQTPPNPQAKQTRSAPAVKAPTASAPETQALDRSDTDPNLARRAKPQPARKETQTAPKPKGTPAEDEESLRWEGPSKDTNEMQALSDTVPRPPRKPNTGPTRKKKPVKATGLKQQQFWIWIAVAGGVILLLLALFLWWMFSGQAVEPTASLPS